MADTSFSAPVVTECQEDHVGPPELSALLSQLHTDEFYSNGTWTTPQPQSSLSASASDSDLDSALESVKERIIPVPKVPVRVINVIDPSTAQSITSIPVASSSDINAAIRSAREAQPAWSDDTITSIEERVGYFHTFRELYNKEENQRDLALILSAEMGSPIDFARENQVGVGSFIMDNFLEIMEDVVKNNGNGGDNDDGNGEG
eukprot:CAMPEP_0194123126 /NCGR_PEP_ID=MMETSP0150-20130528/53414_1 /TAXON_ID=122233 /ORGANISM="Chaetoceros debilis, Strain MM31A-1" /LENGTH=203 /DNA_ID=CAMNT_0038816255 /DNA_START=46 /DNA_END=653 /DNA_ORIENTATION=+